MTLTPKEAINLIANGSDYYFRFSTIEVIKNDKILKKITKDNCEDPTSTFRKGGSFSGIVTKLDFEEEGLEEIQSLGALIGMDYGFDLYITEPWTWIEKNEKVHSIAYYLMGGTIDVIIFEARDIPNAIQLQILTSDGFIIRLSDPIIFSVS